MGRAQQIIGSGPNRVKDDFYPTPTAATLALLDVEEFEGSVFEPACGNGAISEILIGRGMDVHSTDLVDRGYGKHGLDFLEYDGPKFANVITNPPFKIATDFVRKSLEVAEDKVAIFLKIQFLEGVARRELFKNSPLKTVYVFSDRVSFNEKSGMLCFAWFVWQKSYTGKPQIDWLLSKNFE